jgi:hypothetical protein
MAIIAVGSDTLPAGDHGSPPDLVGWRAAERRKFDPRSEIHQAAKLAREGKIRSLTSIQFVMAVIRNRQNCFACDILKCRSPT